MTVNPDDDLRERIERARLHGVRAASERLVDAHYPELAGDDHKAAVDRVFEKLRKRIRDGDPTIPTPVVPAGVSGLQFTERQVQAMVDGEGGFTLDLPRGRANPNYGAKRKRDDTST